MKGGRQSIGANSATSSVTPYIIGMAKALILSIVAEGVEIEEQADYLTRTAFSSDKVGCTPKPFRQMSSSTF